MKKLTKILSGVACLALLGSLIACNPDTVDPTDEKGNSSVASTVYSGDLITFNAIEASVNAENVVLIVKYDRSAIGAAEKIKLEDVNLEVTYNGQKISMPSTLDLALDEYADGFADAVKDDNGKILDAKYINEYKVKLPLGKKISVNDKVTVELKSAKVSGEGKDSVKLGSILISLIDTAKEADWYNELCEHADEYQPLITKANGVSFVSGNAGTSGSVGENGEIILLDEDLVLTWNGGLVISGEKFTGAAGKKLCVTISSVNGGFKMNVCEPWTDVILNPEAEEDDAKTMNYNPDFELDLTEELVEEIVAGHGLKIYGDATISSVVIR